MFNQCSMYFKSIFYVVKFGFVVFFFLIFEATLHLLTKLYYHEKENFIIGIRSGDAAGHRNNDKSHELLGVCYCD